MVDFIDDHKPQYGVEPICRVLPIAPSTYYRAKELEFSPEKRSQRSQHDDEPPRYCRRLNILREYDNENMTLHS